MLKSHTKLGQRVDLRWPRLLVVGLVAIYVTGFLLWYSATPLGLFPVLDGREQLTIAHQIATGELPNEPFYRAMVYPAIAATMLGGGIGDAHLAIAMRGFNGACHLISVFLVGWMTWRLWQHQGAAWIAAGLWGMYPVALHFAADPLAVTPAITLMLGGFSVLLYAGQVQIRWRTLAVGLAGVIMALSALTRPQLWALMPAWAVLLGCEAYRLRASAFFASGIAAVVMTAVLAGIVNHEVSGEFRVLPLQGAFNL